MWPSAMSVLRRRARCCVMAVPEDPGPWGVTVSTNRIESDRSQKLTQSVSDVIPGDSQPMELRLILNVEQQLLSHAETCITISTLLRGGCKPNNTTRAF